jgi:hypothetical protein
VDAETAEIVDETPTAANVPSSVTFMQGAQANPPAMWRVATTAIDDRAGLRHVRDRHKAPHTPAWRGPVIRAGRAA